MSKEVYYLGIDGGGTKTEFVLCDNDGRIINSCILDGCNPNDVGIDKCLELLENGCRNVCCSVPFEKISVFAGIAGASGSITSAEIISCLNSLGFAQSKCESDTSLAVAMTVGINDGVAVIMGTGIVVIVQKSGEQKLIGGYNYFFDKGGSGFNLGRDAVNYALLCEERNLPKTPLYCAVLDKCQTDTVRQNLKNFYKYGKMYIAQFSKCVTETLLADAQSEIIINENMSCVGEMINYALTLLDGENNVYITGGLSSQKDIIADVIQKHINNNCILHFVNEKPVIGALKLAGLENNVC